MKLNRKRIKKRIRKFFRITVVRFFDIIRCLAVRPLVKDPDKLKTCIESVRNIAKSDTASKKFLIIVRSGSCGLLTYVSSFLAVSLYAFAKGMIPVFDMQSEPNVYLEEDEVGRINAWEYYFKQPFGYSLADVYEGKYKYSRCNPKFNISKAVRLPEEYESGRQGLSPIWSLLYENLFQLSDEAERYIDEEYNRIIKPDMRVLGIYTRGTDYTWRRFPGHWVQPEVPEVIEKVREVLDKWTCSHIFVASEERKTVDQFESAFPGKVLTVSQRYYDELDIDYSIHKLAKAKFDRENDAYLRGMEYLACVIILSRCSSAIMGLSGGSISALSINGGKYENTYIYDMGKYPKK